MQCFLGPEPADGFQIMPASVMLPSGSILTATRTTGPASIEMVAGATGGGVRRLCTTKAVLHHFSSIANRLPRQARDKQKENLQSKLFD